MSDSYDDKKQCVLKLISRGSDKKLMVGAGNRKEAFVLLQKAQRLAEDLPKPWKALVAYRLAHLRMRSGHLSDEDLNDVDDLFSQASRQAESLGPLPALYRLAVLTRMKNVDRDRLEEARKRALEKISSWREGERQVTIRIQFPEFNMLEMLSYAASLPYDGLEGLCADPEADPVQPLAVVLERKTRGYWHRLGWSTPTPGQPFKSLLAYSREFALEELEDEQVSSDLDLIFRCSGTEYHWKSRHGDWTKEELHVKLLALIVAQIPAHTIRLRLQVSEDTFRQRKSRLKRAVKELTGREIRLSEDSEGQLRLPDDLRVAGAVSAEFLRRAR